MSEKITEIYRSILDFAGMGVRDDGTIYARLLSSQKPKDVLVNGEPLVFPCRKQYDDPNQNKIYFHPFSENFLRGESEVIQTLREHIVTRLNFVTGVTGQYLLALLGSPELHKNLTEEQTSLLVHISEADHTSSTNWSKIMTSLIKNQHDSGYVKLYLKRAGTWKGNTYSRIGVVTFPFYKDLVAGKYERERVKDKTSFKKIMEFIFPDINETEGYNYGTRTQVAPFLDALMKTSGTIAGRLNDIVTTYQEYIPDYEDLLFNVDWVPAFENLNDLNVEIRHMPELKGNAGTTTVAERNHPPQELQHQANQYQAPTPEPVAAVQQPQVQVQPYQQPIQQPVIQQPQIPQVRQNESGKVNFNDMLRANPALAYQPNPLAPQMPGVVQFPGQMRQPAPSWAQPQMPVMQPGYPAPAGYPQMGMPQAQFVGYPNQAPQPQLPPAQPGYQWVINPANGQFVQVPLQQPMQPQMMPQGGPPPAGWNYR